MLSGIGTVANLNQDNLHGVQGQLEEPHGTRADAAEGKVNALESLTNSSNESDLKKETRSEDMSNRNSREERIIDLLG
jgi:hypothetical protein